MSQRTSWWCKSRRAQSKDDFETWLEGGVAPTLNAFDNGDTRAVILVAYPIDDAREIEKHQNGTGIGNEGDPAYILDTRQASAVVAFDTKFGSNANTFEDQTPTLKATQGAPSVVMPTLSASNNPSRSPQSAEVTAQVAAMVEATSIVRRLTPTECERLQGFPDGYTADQADSHRYKQMGNAVAVPVVEWIVKRLLAPSELLRDGQGEG